MNNSQIKILREDVICKISAGEVVERPASVVKELVENSIDAGAGSISIDIESAGQALIRVADDGNGMTPEDAKLACTRHATSKIADIGDLDRLNTFGFRGEALASIAAVSQMDLVTRRQGTDAGTHIELESGEIRRIRPAGRDTGTTIEVRNLFFNVPARRKFLKKDATELAEIASVVGHFAVSYPAIEFRLAHGVRTILHVTPSMDMLERIRLVLGGDVADSMVDVSFSSGLRNVKGFISLPSSTRKDKSSQLFFVNGRNVRSRALGDALHDAYASMLERGRYPSAVLFVDLPSSEIDVNVHPTKLLVKFDDEKNIKALVSDAIRLRFDALKTVKQHDAVERSFPGPAPFSTSHETAEVFHSDAPGIQTQFSYDIKKESGGKPAPWGWPAAKTSPERRDVETPGIFQLGDCYIVRMSQGEIEITDQHAAHERVFYEYFTKAVSGGAHDVQSLLFPVRLDLSASDTLIMSKILDAFKALGFLIEAFGERSYVVQGVPALLKDRDVKAVVMDALTDLSEKDLAKIDVVDEMVKIMSCRAAVKAGDKLTADEMYAILEQLYRCDLPFTCPHGRPTIIELKVGDLERMFRRK